MRIGINALYRSNGGSLTNLAQLLHDWHAAGLFEQHEIVIFTSPWTARGLQDQLPSHVLQACDVEVFQGSDRGLAARLWFEQVVLPRRARAKAIDVLFCPANTMPLATGIPTVVTFQNAAPFCDRITPATVGWSLWRRFRILGIIIALSARRATRIICISYWFRDLCARRFGVAPERSAVIYRARDPVFGNVRGAASAPVHPRPYLLLIAHIWPYKNIVELAQGFIRARAAVLDCPFDLVVAGRHFWPPYEREVNSALAALENDASRIQLVGEITHADTAAWLAQSAAFVFSSTCENCPTVLIEAMAAGTAVVSSNVGVMPEILGDAAMYFDPADVDSIAAALESIMSDPALRAELARRGLERSRRFPDREEVARRTFAELVAALTPPEANA